MSSYISLKEDYYWDYKHWKKLISQIITGSGNYTIFKSYTVLDWYEGKIPSPPTVTDDTIESSYTYEGNWPLYWTYEAMPPRIDSEAFQEISNYQQATHNAAVSYTVLTRQYHFFYDMENIDEKSWMAFIDNEIGLVKEELTDNKLITKVYRDEIDRRYLSPNMCREIQKFITKGFQFIEYSLPHDNNIEFLNIENDGWRGSNDPFDLGELFNTYVNLEYLEVIKSIRESLLKSGNKANGDDSKYKTSDFSEILRDKLVDLNIPDWEGDLESLFQELSRCALRLDEIKKELDSREISSKSKLDKLIETFVWEKFEPKEHSRKMIAAYLKGWQLNQGATYPRKTTVDELTEEYPKLKGVYDSSGGVIGNWEDGWNEFKNKRTENK